MPDNRGNIYLFYEQEAMIGMARVAHVSPHRVRRRAVGRGGRSPRETGLLLWTSSERRQHGELSRFPTCAPAGALHGRYGVISKNCRNIGCFGSMRLHFSVAVQMDPVFFARIICIIWMPKLNCQKIDKLALINLQ